MKRFGWWRRRRLAFLLNVLHAPTGVSRPVDSIRAEIQDLIDREFGVLD